MDVVLQLVSAGGVVMYTLIFLGGLGLPVPVSPMLVLLGAGLAGGKISPIAGALLPPALLCLGDTVWFFIGRRYGTDVLRSVCKISLERDTCVQRTQNAFQRFGVRVMLFSRFVPGLSTLAAPMAGANRDTLPRFVLFDLGGVTLFSGVFVLLGFFFAGQVGRVLDALASVSGNATTLGVLALLVYAVYKFSTRRWLIHKASQLAIDPKEAHARRTIQPQILIFDIRGAIDINSDPFTIAGAQRVDELDLFDQLAKLPASTEIYLFCNCPNQASSTRVAIELRKRGFNNARPIRDGMAGWRNANLPLEPITQPTANLSSAAATA